jgi:hypothetical protein
MYIMFMCLGIANYSDFTKFDVVTNLTTKHLGGNLCAKNTFTVKIKKQRTEICR